jgi:hypothetical protein
MDRAAILTDYDVLRAVGIPLNTELVKTLSQGDIGAAASALGMRHGKAIELETHDEIAVLMDYAIHEIRRDGKNAVQRMLEEDPPPEGSAELRLLRSMKDARHTILEVESTARGLGVHCLDGPERAAIFLVDNGFSRTAMPGAALAARIHSPGNGWWMTTGAALPLNPEAMVRLLSDFERHQARTGRFPSPAEQTRLTIRACVAEGASRQILYGKPGEDAKELAARRDEELGLVASRVGRNDPCPCGSGKKYKKCCGRND